MNRRDALKLIVAGAVAAACNRADDDNAISESHLEAFGAKQDKAFNLATHTMFTGAVPAPGMRSYCQELKAIAPCPLWTDIQSLDFETDVTRLGHWLGEVFAKNPPAADIGLFYFGLSDMGDELSLSGYRKVEEGRDGMQPADHVRWPKQDEAESTVLKAIQTMADRQLQRGDDDNRWIAETCLPLVYAGLSVSHLFRTLDPQKVLSGATKRLIAVCFDEGDFFLLGEMAQTGWRFHEVPSWAG